MYRIIYCKILFVILKTYTLKLYKYTQILYNCISKCKTLAKNEDNQVFLSEIVIRNRKTHYVNEQ